MEKSNIPNGEQEKPVHIVGLEQGRLMVEFVIVVVLALFNFIFLLTTFLGITELMLTMEVVLFTNIVVCLILLSVLGVFTGMSKK